MSPEFVNCSPQKTTTNVLMFALPPHVPPRPFIDRLRERGVQPNYPSKPTIRAVTHRMVEAVDIDLALGRIRSVVQEFPAVQS